MVADAILDCSARGDSCSIPFSAVVHDHRSRTHRPTLLRLEIDPLYVDTIVRRWQAFCGDQARHAVTTALSTKSRPERGERHVG